MSHAANGLRPRGRNLLIASLALLLVAMLAAPAFAQEQRCRCKRQCQQRCHCRQSTSSGCGGSGSADDSTANRRSPRSGSAAGRSVAANEVDLVAEVLDLQPGMVFAEVGAGNGRFSVRLADYVGPEGRVYANELGDRRIRAIERMIEQAGAENIVAVAGEIDDTNLPEGAIDALMMRMVYHMMTAPEPMNRSFFRALKPGGTMLIIDGYPKRGPDAPGVPENRSGMGIDPDITIDEVTSAGFEYVRLIEQWPNVGYALVFRKPAQ